MKLGCTPNMLKPAAGAAPIIGEIERAADFGLKSIMAIFVFMDPRDRTQAFFDSVAEASQRRGVELRLGSIVQAGSPDTEVRKRDVEREIAALREGHEKAGIGFASVANWPMSHTRWAPEPPMDERIDIIAENLATIADAVPGMLLGVENHCDYRGYEIAAILEKANRPNLKAQLDTGNAFTVFEDPIDCAKALAKWTVSVHLKDVRVTPFVPAGPAPGIRGEAVPLGQGMVDNAAICQILSEQAPDPKSIRLVMEPLYMPEGIDPEQDFLVPSIAWARERLAAYLD